MNLALVLHCAPLCSHALHRWLLMSAINRFRSVVGSSSMNITIQIINPKHNVTSALIVPRTSKALFRTSGCLVKYMNLDNNTETVLCKARSNQDASQLVDSIRVKYLDPL